MSKAQQAVYDIIKKVREGYPTPLTFHGVDYLIVPYQASNEGSFVYNDKVIPYSYYLTQDVLCKYHRRKIGVQTICWKDAGPNPRLYSVIPGGFIPHRNIYGIAIRMDEIHGNHGAATQNGTS